MTEPASYGLRRRLRIAFDDALTALTAALKEQGFGVLTEIDVQATLKQKIGVDFRKYRILGACNPHLAHRALGVELELGLLLPCNVIVYEDGDEVVVSAVDPDAMLGVAANPALGPIAAEARERLERAVAAVAG